MGHTLEAILAMWRENCIFQEKIVFCLGESAILGLRRAEIRPRWYYYVVTKMAYVGPGFDLCWLRLAHVGRKVAFVGLCGPRVGLQELIPT